MKLSILWLTDIFAWLTEICKITLIAYISTYSGWTYILLCLIRVILCTSLAIWSKKNPAYRRHQHSRPMQIVGLIQRYKFEEVARFIPKKKIKKSSFFRGCMIFFLSGGCVIYLNNFIYLFFLHRLRDFMGGIVA